MKLDQAIQQHLENMPLALQGEVLDFVLYLETKNKIPPLSDSERRKSLSRALEKTASLNPYAGIEPAEWLKAQREDRALPARN